MHPFSFSYMIRMLIQYIFGYLTFLFFHSPKFEVPIIHQLWLRKAKELRTKFRQVEVAFGSQHRPIWAGLVGLEVATIEPPYSHGSTSFGQGAAKLPWNTRNWPGHSGWRYGANRIWDIDLGNYGFSFPYHYYPKSCFDMGFNLWSWNMWSPYINDRFLMYIYVLPDLNTIRYIQTFPNPSSLYLLFLVKVCRISPAKQLIFFGWKREGNWNSLIGNGKAKYHSNRNGYPSVVRSPQCHQTCSLLPYWYISGHVWFCTMRKLCWTSCIITYYNHGSRGVTVWVSNQYLNPRYFQDNLEEGPGIQRQKAEG